MLAKQKETAKKWLSKISRNKAIRNSKISGTINNGSNKKKIEIKEFRKKLSSSIKFTKRYYGRKLTSDEIGKMKKIILTKEI